MDKRQKSALRGNSLRLADQLIMDEDLYAALKQHKVFTESMLQMIRVLPKPKDQVYKLLELLEKRGPNAFSAFVEILSENYSWLADELKETYRQKQQIQQQKADETNVKGFYHHIQPRPRAQTPREPNRRHAALDSTDAKAKQFGGTRDSGMDDGSVSTSYYKSSVSTDAAADDVFHFTDTSTSPTLSNGNEYAVLHNQSEKSTKTRKVKIFKDTCVSPINTYNSPRQVAHATCSPIQMQKEYTFENYNINTKLEKEIDSDDDYDDIESDDEQRESEKDSDGSVSSENVVDGRYDKKAGEATNDDLDGIKDECNLSCADDSEDEVRLSDENLDSSEVFYDTLRRKSQILDDEQKRKLQEDIERSSLQDEDNESSSGETSGSGESVINDEDSLIEDMYVKCLRYTLERSDVKDETTKESIIDEKLEAIKQEGITTLMIDEQIDELIGMNDDKKQLIDQCFVLFGDKDKKLSLVKLIEKEKDEKKELKDRLLDEIRKTNEMANDMYKHSLEMKNIEKMKAKLTQLEEEKKELIMKCKTADTEKNRHVSLIETMRVKIESLERKATEEKKAGRTKQGTVRKSTSLLTSPRKPSHQANRIATLQSAYHSPRTNSQSTLRPGLYKTTK